MTLFSRIRRLSIGAISCLCIASTASFACTGITLSGEDGTLVFARTMEWGTFDLEGEFIVIPRGTELNATKMNDGKDGLKWNAKYGVAGTSGMGTLIMGDAVNETGLTVGTFYLPGYTEPQPYIADKAAISLSPTDVTLFLASQFSTIAEIREGLPKVRVVPVKDPIIGIVQPVHYVVTEAGGDAVVIQYIEGELTIFDAPLGVVTNAPNYDWHIDNLNNYLNLSAIALPAVELGGQSFAPLGAGSGMIGLPGDFTPPSRFVRAVAFTQTARPTEGGFDTVRETFRILDNFNIPIAAAEGAAGSDDLSTLIYSATQWTVATDITNMRMYYHTQWNRDVRMVDLNKIDFGDTSSGIRRAPLDQTREPSIKEVDTFGQ